MYHCTKEYITCGEILSKYKCSENFALSSTRYSLAVQEVTVTVSTYQRAGFESFDRVRVRANVTAHSAVYKYIRVKIYMVSFTSALCFLKPTANKIYLEA